MQLSFKYTPIRINKCSAQIFKVACLKSWQFIKNINSNGSVRMFQAGVTQGHADINIKELKRPTVVII